MLLMHQLVAPACCAVALRIQARHSLCYATITFVIANAGSGHMAALGVLCQPLQTLQVQAKEVSLLFPLSSPGQYGAF